MAKKKATTPKRDRSEEYAKRRAQRAQQEQKPGGTAEEVFAQYPSERQKVIEAELIILSRRTANSPMDADRDIDFAYRAAGNPVLSPLECPSVGAWNWYEYARNMPVKFLEICAKREDAKTKQSGSVTSQRMEDDKRKQFSILDRIEKHLKMDVKTIIQDMMAKFPDDVFRECFSYKEQLKSYRERFPE